ncbi:MAG: RagB/SusD family nutrient uptake outer membrane protein [Bacteroidota bacterium]
MKHHLIYVVLGLFLLGCDDFLDQQPGTEISIDEQLSTKTGVEQALAGIYTGLEDLLSGRFILYADLQGGNLTFSPGDDLLVTVPSSSTLNIVNSYDFFDNEIASDYQGYYEGVYGIINQANTILERVDKYDFFSTNEREQLIAELLTFRAFAHYQVAIHYAQNYHFTPDATHNGVVYNLRTVAPGVDFPGRLNVRDTYEQLKQDLDNALQRYQDQNILTSIPSYAHFNRVNTLAIYARIALQMNDWERARAHANEVIVTSGISLTSGQDYISEWESDNQPISEVLLEFLPPRSIEEDDSEGEISSTVAPFFRFTDENNYGEIVASGDLLDLYDPTDIRSDMFLEALLPTSVNQIVTNLPYYFTKKFQGDAGAICIRLSEMYLVRAEANARLGSEPEALSDLNILRERAGLASIFQTSELLEEIFLERRRELAFEGHLLFDLIRHEKDVTRDQGCISSQCNLSYPSDFFILPIPFSSTGLNENIAQNDGY